MKRFFSRFKRNESGAVTVDWVVLTAALVGLAIGVTTVITTNTTDLSDATATAIGARVTP
ncbi:MAG: Flp family type IVb pilin [Shimia sp.]|uniref:Flp family type IVb pilin n=1 Tax=Shimia sp. TaxID=1954381 RepID=UPI004059E750